MSVAITEAEKVLQDNFVAQPPVPVYDIARKNGLKIARVHFPTKYSHIQGFITKENNAYIMYVNADDSIGEQNFTIAHELGHWKLHKAQLEKDLNKSVLFRLSIAELNKDKLEAEANLFAATLLIPDELYEKYKDDLDQKGLADKFGVSEDIIGYKLKLLQEKDKSPDGVVQKEETTPDGR